MKEKNTKNYFTLSTYSYLVIEKKCKINSKEIEGLFDHLNLIGYNIEYKKIVKKINYKLLIIKVIKIVAAILFFRSLKNGQAYSNTPAINTRIMSKNRMHREFKACFWFTNPYIMLNRLKKVKLNT